MDGDGALSGSVSIGADVPDGFYVLRVADGVKSASAPLEVKASVGPPRLISVDDSGSVGTRIMVYGTQFNPGKHVTLQAVNAGGEGVGHAADVVSDGEWDLLRPGLPHRRRHDRGHPGHRAGRPGSHRDHPVPSDRRRRVRRPSSPCP
ncbi:hypothetical protein ACU686_10385 [Yinghuangia aomiensis]